ncbi:MAG: hypothetical protein STSR0007_00230 [Thermovirga sp.]
MKTRHLCTLFVALLACTAFFGIASAAECSPEGPDAEPLFEIDNFSMGKLDGNLVMSFRNHEESKDIRLTLDKQQAQELLSYALKARDAAPGMNPFAPSLGDAQIPKPQRPMEPLLLNTIEGQSLWSHVVGRDYRNGSFFAYFLLASTEGDGSPDNRYMLKLKIYETPPTYPTEKIIIDKETGLPIGEPETPGPRWGKEFEKFIAGLDAFVGSKLLVIG